MMGKNENEMPATRIQQSILVVKLSRIKEHARPARTMFSNRKTFGVPVSGLSVNAVKAQLQEFLSLPT